MARTQYGILGINGCCAVDRNTHECGIQGKKAKEEKIVGLKINCTLDSGQFKKWSRQ